MSHSTDDILTQATDILGQPVKIEEHRGWGIWWCPFHADAEKAGNSRKPNFGVNLVDGHWCCLRCGASGPSIAALQQKLGKYQPPANDKPTRVRRKSQVELLDEALSETRAIFPKSPAAQYVRQERHLNLSTALTYGLGYGLPKPPVSRETWLAAKESLLVFRGGVWGWAGGVIYADPPTSPTVINVRYLPDDLLPTGTRNFEPKDNHHTWGDRLRPLGSWRLRPSTQVVIVLEGLFDMLIAAQEIERRKLYPEVVPVYTNGAKPSYHLLEWFSTSPYEYILVQDPDEAGDNWQEMVTGAICRGEGRYHACRPPDDLDPDEAFLDGWWPAMF
jgi:hypothetical protein